MPKRTYTPAPASNRLVDRAQTGYRSALPKLPFGLQAVRDPENGQVRVIAVTGNKQGRSRG